jgi:RNase P/RNase MRP subunit POP5
VDSELSLRRLVEEAGSGLFGTCGAAALRVDVLRAAGGRALLRVPAPQLRRLRASLALSDTRVRVLAQAPSLQALL